MIRGIFKKRRGVSLVEEVCAAAILVMVVVGLLYVIGCSHASIFSYNSHDKAAANVQEVSDRVMAVLAQDPEDADGSADVLGDGNASVFQYDDPTPAYSNKVWYAYKKVNNTGVDNNPLTGYDVSVLKYYSKTEYVKYNSYVSCTGKDV